MKSAFPSISGFSPGRPVSGSRIGRSAETQLSSRWEKVPWTIVASKRHWKRCGFDVVVVSPVISWLYSLVIDYSWFITGYNRILVISWFINQMYPKFTIGIGMAKKIGHIYHCFKWILLLCCFGCFWEYTMSLLDDHHRVLFEVKLPLKGATERTYWPD